MTTIAWLWQGNCEETERHLSDRVDGELRGLRRFRILRHLARCELCAAALESLRRTVESLWVLGRPETAPALSLADDVVERIWREQELGR
jgi:anti-sigma factor RsiW